MSDRGVGLNAHPLTQKQSDVLLLLYAYTEEGPDQMTVRELTAAVRETAETSDPWDWTSHKESNVRDTLMLLEARSLVVSDGGSPAAWRLTDLGQAYMDAPSATPDPAQAILNTGYEQYLDSVGPNHSHSHARMALQRGTPTNAQRSSPASDSASPASPGVGS